MRYLLDNNSSLLHYDWLRIQEPCCNLSDSNTPKYMSMFCWRYMRQGTRVKEC